MATRTHPNVTFIHTLPLLFLLPADLFGNFSVSHINHADVCSKYTKAIWSFLICYVEVWGHAVAQWLRHCATNRKVVGSIPDGVTEIFH
jgi:hypothetical protein